MPRGVYKRTPKHNAAIREGMLNSEAAKANADKMRGGHDMVWHHYLYDHFDLLKNRVAMTRSMHVKLHYLLKKLDYIVPHINVKEI